MQGAIPVKRGCGTRVKGGVYWELAPHPNGRPLRDFLLDPPQLLPVDLVVPDRGIAYLTTPDGVTHLVDRVGMTDYPYPLDYVVEVGNFGVSRRMPNNIDVGRLDPKRSRLVLVHDRAYLNNYTQLIGELMAQYPSREPAVTCPKHLDHHPLHYPDQMFLPRNIRDWDNTIMEVNDTTCVNAWWHLFDPTKYELGVGYNPTNTHGVVVREMPSFHYATGIAPEGFKPDYRPAMFASFPCSRFVVVKDEDDVHKPTANRLRENTDIPVDEVDQ